jgi:hypothetical protein
MKHLSVTATSFVLSVVLAVSAVQAQATRTWVSGAGDDLNPCTRTAPCQTFVRAISVTVAGGEISVLDSGGFGAVTITKAITIDGQGALASILTSGSSAITVNAGANDRVVLRNLSLQGAGTASNGIRFLAGQSLLVENVSINGFAARGIDMSLTATAMLVVRDSSITNAPTGVYATTSSGFAAASLDNVHLTGLTNGFEGASLSRVTISNSVISGNLGSGVLAGAGSHINVEGCQIAYNSVAGINASAPGALIRIADSEIYHNNGGITYVSGAVVESDGTNRNAGSSYTLSPNSTTLVH